MLPGNEIFKAKIIRKFSSVIRDLIPGVLSAIQINGCTNNESPVSIDNNNVKDNSCLQATLEDMGDHYLYRGDIMLLKDDPENQEFIRRLSGSEASRKNNTTTGAVTRGGIVYWPNAVVPFCFRDDWTESKINCYYSGVGRRFFVPSFTMNTDFNDSKML